MTTFATLTTATSALADITTISAGGVYGGHNQTKAYCYAMNPDTKSYFIDSIELIKQDGAVVATSGTCFPGTRGYSPYVGAGGTCQISADIAADAAYGCRWVIRDFNKGARPNIRGTMDIRDNSDKVLTSSPLR